MMLAELSAWRDRLEKIIEVLRDKVPAPTTNSVSICSFDFMKYFVGRPTIQGKLGLVSRAEYVEKFSEINDCRQFPRLAFHKLLVNFFFCKTYKCFYIMVCQQHQELTVGLFTVINMNSKINCTVLFEVYLLENMCYLETVSFVEWLKVTYMTP